MDFFVEYFKLIDLLALAALACAALVRNRSVWLFVAGILVANLGRDANHGQGLIGVELMTHDFHVSMWKRSRPLHHTTPCCG